MTGLARSTWRWLLAASSLMTATGSAEERVVAYVQNWIDLPAFARKIDYARITHLNLAFENPVDDRGELSFHAGDGALLAAAHAHHVPVLVSIGGGSASEDAMLRQRYFLLQSSARRADFVAGLVEYVTQHAFDGLDVDLEGPAIGADYGAFIADLSVALKARDKLLTAALSQGYGGATVPEAAFSHFDFVNIMAYDAAGPWNPEKPGPHASMEFAQSNVRYWLERGLPKSKAVLGVPFYGHGFGQALKASGYPYRDIVAAYPGVENADQAGHTIYFNGLATMRAKATFVKESGLGGMMIWSLEQDAAEPFSLLSAISGVLRGP